MNDGKKTERQTVKNEKLISWQAPEFTFHKKSTDWFWAVGITTIALIIASILIRNFLLVILAGISGFSILMYGAKRPNIIDFSISNKGIQAGNKIYFFDDLKYFWIRYDPPHTKQIILESNKLLMTHLSIPLGDIDPDVAKETLLKFIKEKKIEESFSETVSKFLGF